MPNSHVAQVAPGPMAGRTIERFIDPYNYQFPCRLQISISLSELGNNTVYSTFQEPDP